MNTKSYRIGENTMNCDFQHCMFEQKKHKLLKKVEDMLVKEIEIKYYLTKGMTLDKFLDYKTHESYKFFTRQVRGYPYNEEDYLAKFHKVLVEFFVGEFKDFTKRIPEPDIADSIKRMKSENFMTDSEVWGID